MFNCNYSNNHEIYNKLSTYDIVVNYNDSKNYNDILQESNFIKVHSLSNSSIYKKN